MREGNYGKSSSNRPSPRSGSKKHGNEAAETRHHYVDNGIGAGGTTNLLMG